MNPTGLTARKCVFVWVALIALLFLTLLLAETNLGRFNTVAALTIAVGQMLLIILFFMQVRYERPLTWIFVSAGLIWLLIMFDLTLADYLTRTAPIHAVMDNIVK